MGVNRKGTKTQPGSDRTVRSLLIERDALLARIQAAIERCEARVAVPCHPNEWALAQEIADLLRGGSDG